MKAILVCHFEPRPVGHGGHRRAYQICHDLGEAFGAGNVLQADSMWAYYKRPGRRQRIAELLDNPLKIHAKTYFSRHLFEFPGFLAHYESLVSGIREPALCFIEHAGFASLLPINARRGLRTVICPQNVESFDTALNGHGRVASYARSIDFANELRVLAACDERLLISKVEAGLLGGLGLHGHYYPYRAVGEVRERLLRIRSARARTRQDRGLFLVLGTAAHDSTRQSMAWFTSQASERGLPANARVVVAGQETERLLPEGRKVPNLELRGWVEEDELDRLLIEAAAVCLPQRNGFGAVTRIAELACAGLPLLVSRHASFAIDPPPEACVIDDDWRCWTSAIEQIQRQPAVADAEAYLAWESSQPNPLVSLLDE